MFRKLKSVVVFLKIIAFIIVIIPSKRVKAQKVDRSVTIYHKAKTAKREYKASICKTDCWEC